MRFEKICLSLGFQMIERNRMKRFFLIVGLFASMQMTRAADSVYVQNPQIPILIDRMDNVLFRIRIPDATKGDVLNRLTIRFGNEDKLSEVKAVRLFYAGTEAATKGRSRFAPVTYVSSHNIRNTRSANPSYSVRQDEVTTVANTLTLKTRQPMVKGINYFWVSVEMDRNTSLLSKLTPTVTEAVINDKPAVIAGEQAAVRRMGIGVRHAGDDGSASFRIPGLVTTNKGTLLGVYDVRYNNSVDLQEHVDVGLSRSTDKGQTWEPMRIAMSFGETDGLPSGQNGVGDPSILVDERTNTVWVVAAWTHGMGNARAWTNSMPGMTPDETAQLMMVKSTDDGRTWSEPINITSQVKDPSWCFLLQGPGRGITMRDGTLVFPIQFIDSLRVPHAGIMYSKDRGETWHIHQPARTNTTEAQVAEVEPGVLMLNMRDNRGGSRAVSITRDLGKSWTEHSSNRSALPESICMASLISVKAKDNITGKDLLLFSNPNTTEGRHHITIKASLDGGVTWLPAHQVLLDEEDGWGYSCLSMIDRETVGIFYESSVAHMTFQAVKIKDLIR